MELLDEKVRQLKMQVIFMQIKPQDVLSADTTHHMWNDHMVINKKNLMHFIIFSIEIFSIL